MKLPAFDPNGPYDIVLEDGTLQRVDPTQSAVQTEQEPEPLSLIDRVKAMPAWRRKLLEIEDPALARRVRISEEDPRNLTAEEIDLLGQEQMVREKSEPGYEQSFGDHVKDVAAGLGSRLIGGYYKLGEVGQTGLQLLGGGDTARRNALEARWSSDQWNQLGNELLDDKSKVVQFAGKVAGASPSLLPAVAAGPLGFGAVVASSGLQQGLSTLSDAQAETGERGITGDVLLPSAIDAVQTAAITAVTGKLFGMGAEGLTLPAKQAAIRNWVGNAIKSSFGEALEEGAQQFISDYFISQMYKPGVTPEQAFKSAVEAAAVGGVLGFGMASAHGKINKSNMERDIFLGGPSDEDVVASANRAVEDSNASRLERMGVGARPQPASLDALNKLGVPRRTGDPGSWEDRGGTITMQSAKGRGALNERGDDTFERKPEDLIFDRLAREGQARRNRLALLARGEPENAALASGAMDYGTGGEMAPPPSVPSQEDAETAYAPITIQKKLARLKDGGVVTLPSGIMLVASKTETKEDEDVVLRRGPEYPPGPNIGKRTKVTTRVELATGSGANRLVVAVAETTDGGINWTYDAAMGRLLLNSEAVSAQEIKEKKASDKKALELEILRNEKEEKERRHAEFLRRHAESLQFDNLQAEREARINAKYERQLAAATKPQEPESVANFRKMQEERAARINAAYQQSLARARERKKASKLSAENQKLGQLLSDNESKTMAGVASMINETAPETKEARANKEAADRAGAWATSRWENSVTDAELSAIEERLASEPGQEKALQYVRDLRKRKGQERSVIPEPTTNYAKEREERINNSAYARSVDEVARKEEEQRRLQAEAAAQGVEVPPGAELVKIGDYFFAISNTGDYSVGVERVASVLPAKMPKVSRTTRGVEITYEDSDREFMGRWFLTRTAKETRTTEKVDRADGAAPAEIAVARLASALSGYTRKVAAALTAEEKAADEALVREGKLKRARKSKSVDEVVPPMSEQDAVESVMRWARRTFKGMLNPEPYFPHGPAGNMPATSTIEEEIAALEARIAAIPDLAKNLSNKSTQGEQKKYLRKELVEKTNRLGKLRAERDLRNALTVAAQSIPGYRLADSSLPVGRQYIGRTRNEAVATLEDAVASANPNSAEVKEFVGVREKSEAARSMLKQQGAKAEQIVTPMMTDMNLSGVESKPKPEAPDVREEVAAFQADMAARTPAKAEVIPAVEQSKYGLRGQELPNLQQDIPGLSEEDMPVVPRGMTVVRDEQVAERKRELQGRRYTLSDGIKRLKQAIKQASPSRRLVVNGTEMVGEDVAARTKGGGREVYLRGRVTDGGLPVVRGAEAKTGVKASVLRRGRIKTMLVPKSETRSSLETRIKSVESELSKVRASRKSLESSIKLVEGKIKQAQNSKGAAWKRKIPGLNAQLGKLTNQLRQVVGDEGELSRGAEKLRNELTLFANDKTRAELNAELKALRSEMRQVSAELKQVEKSARLARSKESTQRVAVFKNPQLAVQTKPGYSVVKKQSDVAQPSTEPGSINAEQRNRMIQVGFPDFRINNMSEAAATSVLSRGVSYKQWLSEMQTPLSEDGGTVTSLQLSVLQGPGMNMDPAQAQSLSEAEADAVIVKNLSPQKADDALGNKPVVKLRVRNMNQERVLRSASSPGWSLRVPEQAGPRRTTVSGMAGEQIRINRRPIANRTSLFDAQAEAEAKKNASEQSATRPRRDNAWWSEVSNLLGQLREWAQNPNSHLGTLRTIQVTEGERGRKQVRNLFDMNPAYDEQAAMERLAQLVTLPVSRTADAVKEFYKSNPDPLAYTQVESLGNAFDSFAHRARFEEDDKTDEAKKVKAEEEKAVAEGRKTLLEAQRAEARAKYKRMSPVLGRAVGEATLAERIATMEKTVSADKQYFKANQHLKNKRITSDSTEQERSAVEEFKRRSALHPKLLEMIERDNKALNKIEAMRNAEPIAKRMRARSQDVGESARITIRQTSNDPSSPLGQKNFFVRVLEVVASKEAEFERANGRAYGLAIDAALVAAGLPPVALPSMLAAKLGTKGAKLTLKAMKKFHDTYGDMDTVIDKTMAWLNEKFPEQMKKSGKLLEKEMRRMASEPEPQAVEKEDDFFLGKKLSSPRAGKKGAGKFNVAEVALFFEEMTPNGNPLRIAGMSEAPEFLRLGSELYGFITINRFGMTPDTSPEAFWFKNHKSVPDEFLIFNQFMWLAATDPSRIKNELPAAGREYSVPLLNGLVESLKTAEEQYKEWRSEFTSRNYLEEASAPGDSVRPVKDAPALAVGDALAKSGAFTEQNLKLWNIIKKRYKHRLPVVTIKSGGETSGHYIPILHEIMLNGGKIGKNTKIGSLFMHELIHSLTGIELMGDAKANRELTNILLEVKSQTGSDGSVWYGLTNVDELLAEAFVNPKFQEMLASVQMRRTKIGAKRKSAWSVFVDWVAGIVGLSGEENALSQVLRVGAELMEKSGKDSALEDFLSQDDKRQSKATDKILRSPPAVGSPSPAPTPAPAPAPKKDAQIPAVNQPYRNSAEVEASRSLPFLTPEQQAIVDNQAGVQAGVFSEDAVRAIVSVFQPGLAPAGATALSDEAQSAERSALRDILGYTTVSSNPVSLDSLPPEQRRQAALMTAIQHEKLRVKRERLNGMIHDAKLDPAKAEQVKGYEAALAKLNTLLSAGDYNARIREAAKESGMHHGYFSRFGHSINVMDPVTKKQVAVSLVPTRVHEEENLAKLRDLIGNISSFIADPNSDPVDAAGYSGALEHLNAVYRSGSYAPSAVNYAQMDHTVIFPYLRTRMSLADQIGGRIGIMMRNAFVQSDAVLRQIYAINMDKDFGIEAMRLAEIKALQSHGYGTSPEAISDWINLVAQPLAESMQENISSHYEVGHRTIFGKEITKEDMEYLRKQHRYEQALRKITDTKTYGFGELINIRREAGRDNIVFTRPVATGPMTLTGSVDDWARRLAHEWHEHLPIEKPVLSRMSPEAARLAMENYRADQEAKYQWRTAKLEELIADKYMFLKTIGGMVLNLNPRFDTHSEFKSDFMKIAHKIKHGQLTIENMDQLLAALSEVSGKPLDTPTQRQRTVVNPDGTETTVTETVPFKEYARNSILGRMAVILNNFSKNAIKPTGERKLEDVTKAVLENLSATNSFTDPRGVPLGPSSFYRYVKGTGYELGVFIKGVHTIYQIKELEAMEQASAAMGKYIDVLQKELDRLNPTRTPENEREAQRIMRTRIHEGEYRYNIGQAKAVKTAIDGQINSLKRIISKWDEDLPPNIARFVDEFSGSVHSTLMTSPKAGVGNLFTGMGGATGVFIDMHTRNIRDIIINSMLHPFTLGRAAFGGLSRLALKSSKLKGVASIVPPLLRLIESEAHINETMAQRLREMGINSPSNAALHYEAALKLFGKTWSDLRKKDNNAFTATMKVLFQGGNVLHEAGINGSRAPSAGFKMLASPMNWVNTLLLFPMRQVSPRSLDMWANMTLAYRLERNKAWVASWAKRIGESREAQGLSLDPFDPAQSIKPAEVGLKPRDLRFVRTYWSPVGTLESIVFDYYKRWKAATDKDSVNLLGDDAAVAEERQRALQASYASLENTITQTNSPAFGQGSTWRRLLMALKSYSANAIIQFMKGVPNVFAPQVHWRDRALWGSIMAVLVAALILALYGAATNEAREFVGAAMTGRLPSVPTAINLANAALNGDLSLGEAVRYTGVSVGTMIPYVGNIIDRSAGGGNSRSPFDLTGIIPVAQFTKDIMDTVVRVGQSGDVAKGAIDIVNRYGGIYAVPLNLMPVARDDLKARNTLRALRSITPRDVEMRSFGSGGGTPNATSLTRFMRQAETASYAGDSRGIQSALGKAIDYKMRTKGLTRDEAAREVRQQLGARNPELRVYGRKLADTERSRVLGRMSGAQRSAYETGLRAYDRLLSELQIRKRPALRNRRKTSLRGRRLRSI